MTLREEMDEMKRTTGHSVPPYKLGQMFKMASILLDKLTTSAYMFSYRDIKIILHMMEDSMDKLMEKGKVPDDVPTSPRTASVKKDQQKPRSV